MWRRSVRNNNFVATHNPRFQHVLAAPAAGLRRERACNATASPSARTSRLIRRVGRRRVHKSLGTGKFDFIVWLLSLNLASAVYFPDIYAPDELNFGRQVLQQTIPIPATTTQTIPIPTHFCCETLLPSAFVTSSYKSLRANVITWHVIDAIRDAHLC